MQCPRAAFRSRKSGTPGSGSRQQYPQAGEQVPNDDPDDVILDDPALIRADITGEVEPGGAESAARRADKPLEERPGPLPDLPPPGEVEEKEGIQLSAWERIDKRATHFVLDRRDYGPSPASVLARTSQNLDTGEFFEDRRVIIGESTADLLGPLPLTGKRKYCRLKTILYFDPSHKTPKGFWAGGQWIRSIKGSNNPGIHPDLYRSVSHKQREEAYNLYRERKLGIFAELPFAVEVISLLPLFMAHTPV